MSKADHIVKRNKLRCEGELGLFIEEVIKDKQVRCLHDFSFGALIYKKCELSKRAFAAGVR